MKSDIEYYYNIRIDKLNNYHNYYSFTYATDKYIFVNYERPEEDLKELNNVVRELKTKNIRCHEFVLNKDSKIITTMDNINYVMLKINVFEEQIIDLFDIIDFHQYLVLNSKQSKLYRNNWGELWSKKIDYFEYQIHEIGKDKSIILNSFSYYVGLAENAISYVNNINDSINGNYKLTLSHKRVYNPNYALNFYNPLSFIFDLQVRDIAEYLKSLFFKKDNAYNVLDNYLKKIKLSNYEYHMLYARLLYPSYYFDVYEKIMNETDNEKAIIEIISLVDEYEIFLKNAWILISKYNYIEPIDWIIKKEV